MSRVSDYIQALESSGRHCFPLESAVLETGSTPAGVRAALRRLMRRGRIALPYPGFYLIVPPQYQTLKCLPAEQFIPELMAWRKLDYYVGLLSAASYFGAAHQRPQEFQVIVPRPLRVLVCGAVRVAFIMSSRLAMVSTENWNTPRGFLKVSSPETTAVDLVGYPDRCGGLDHVLLVLSELLDQLESRKLLHACEGQPRAWAQRLGFLLDRAGADRKLTDPLSEMVGAVVRDHVPLAPSTAYEGSPRSSRWKILINADLDLEP